MKKIKSIHTSRTIMFAELEKVMDYAMAGDNFLESLGQNVTGKKSSSGIEKTARHLKNLYGFDTAYPPFVAFKYFWQQTETIDKPLLAIIYAIYHDDLLAESLEVLQETKLGDKAAVELFEKVIERYHPNQYTPITKHSIGKNLASSWKQVGYILGKTKNIRTQPDIHHKIACFAFLMAYLKGERGEFIWNSIGVKALCVYETQLRELAVDCARRDLMQYQHAGDVTSISFTHLLNKINIHAIEN